MVQRDKSGSEAETGRKRRRNRYGLHTGSSGSTRERDWVVGSQILTLQTIPLGSHHGSVQFKWNEGWRLTLVLSPASRPQSLPTSTAEYLIERVEPFQGLSTTSALMTPRRSNVHIIASLGPCSEPRSDSRTRSITKA